MPSTYAWICSSSLRAAGSGNILEGACASTIADCRAPSRTGRSSVGLSRRRRRRRPGNGGRISEALIAIRGRPTCALDLVPELARYVPPATVVDSRAYSALFPLAARWRIWLKKVLDRRSSPGAARPTSAAFSTVLDAVRNIGFRVVIVEDALCSSSMPLADADDDIPPAVHRAVDLVRLRAA